MIEKSALLAGAIRSGAPARGAIQHNAIRGLNDEPERNFSKREIDRPCCH